MDYSGFKRFLLRKRGEETFKTKVVRLEYNNVSLVFEVHSEVELYRVARYGEEKDSLDYFLRNIRDDDVVFDVGASVGLYSVHTALMASRGKVYAFEPDPTTRGCLENNLHLNRMVPGVCVVPWAVSDENGETTLFTDGASGCAPTMRRQPGRERAPAGAVRVVSKTIDSAIISGELPVPTVMKIDIEGAEILCLRGAAQLLGGRLGTKPRVIFLEAHPDFLPGFGSSIDDVFRLIRDSGYSVAWEAARDNQVHYCLQL